QEELEALAERQQQDIDRLESARAERQTALALVEQRIQSRQEELSALENDAAELARLIDELAQALADIPPEIEVPAFSELRGQLDQPVAGGTSQRRFGEPRAGELVWSGWLYAAPGGTEVRAVAYGRVAYADWLRGYGLILILEHGDGFMSLYAHNEALLRDVGDWVRPGEVIATVGDTGGAGQTGLYFELRRDGQPINPAGWIRR
ncbi:MAG: peptidoglycan DD-metalloendopeptidase family protein, partial [Wenzhouxiangella sp.]|nr:peptidoglycan DD-metalloendopeptidase family protein [Wenzhouxiangella sp.]